MLLLAGQGRYLTRFWPPVQQLGGSSLSVFRGSWYLHALTGVMSYIKGEAELSGVPGGQENLLARLKANGSDFACQCWSGQLLCWHIA